MTAPFMGATAQPSSSPQSNQVTIQGTVLDLSHKPVAGASVRLEQKGPPAVVVEAKTNALGAFAFSAQPAGSYLLSAEKSGMHSHEVTVIVAQTEPAAVELVLQTSSPNSSQAMEFADEPNFAVAGVTDWTAVGGHGSDATLRTSEALARDVITLKTEASGSTPAATSAYLADESKLRAALSAAPTSFEANHRLGEFYLHAGKYRESIPLLETAAKIDPANYNNAYDLVLALQGAGEFSQARDRLRNLPAHPDSADLHRLSGDLDEQLGDPLAAVHEYEQAVRLDPSEQNYFAWGSELLLHRAVWQAQEVFKKGAEAYPKSARMLAALGAALFAGALYDQAASQLCAASDLNPADPGPYLFLGKIQIAAPEPLPCVEPKLARFAREQPESALANYFYAMAIWKRQGRPPDPRDLQQVEKLLTTAVTVDNKCSDAYLQLGILNYSQRDFEKAIGLYKQAIAVNPQSGEAHYRLGVAYDRTGEPAKAREEFQLHDEIEKQQAAAVERQRREVKQFLVVLQGQPGSSTTH